jgi:hypothetical protein
MEKSKRQSSRIKKTAAISSLPGKSADRIFPSKKLKNAINFRKPIKPHQYGEIITVDETNLSGIISQPIETKKRRIQTGTDEILGEVIELEDLEKDIAPISEPIQLKKKSRKPQRSPSFEVLSDDEVLPLNRKIKRIAADNIVVSSDEETSDIHGYKNIWEDAIKEKRSNTREEFNSPEKKPHSVLPIPRSQPMHFLNKFIANKSLLLNEPSFRSVGNRGPMMFSSFPMNKHFNGTKACSKVAGNILSDIIQKKKDFDGLFCMQIPNSLRVFNHENVGEVEDKDISLEKQNSSNFINDAEIHFQQKQRNFHKPLALAGFSNSQPFGKLLLLKSGKIVLQVGGRRFDVVSTSPYHDHQTAVIVDFTGSTTSQQNMPSSSSSSLQPNKMALHSLGRIQHVFSAFYNYSKILETLPPLKSSTKCIEEVDLTVDQIDEKLENDNDTTAKANDDHMFKRKKGTTKKSFLSRKSQISKIDIIQKKKKRVEPSKTKATNSRRRKPKPSK